LIQSNEIAGLERDGSQIVLLFFRSIAPINIIRLAHGSHVLYPLLNMRIARDPTCRGAHGLANVSFRLDLASRGVHVERAGQSGRREKNARQSGNAFPQQKPIDEPRRCQYSR
jgi:hypothetical protein